MKSIKIFIILCFIHGGSLIISFLDVLSPNIFGVQLFELSQVGIMTMWLYYLKLIFVRRDITDKLIIVLSLISYFIAVIYGFLRFYYLFSNNLLEFIIAIMMLGIIMYLIIVCLKNKYHNFLGSLLIIVFYPFTGYYIYIMIQKENAKNDNKTSDKEA